MKYFSIFSIFFLVLFLHTNTWSQYQPNSDFDTLKLNSNIYLLRGNALSGNSNCIAQIGEEGTFLVDSNFSYLSDTLKSTLKSLGGSEVRYIVNTHWHGDHTAGNENFNTAIIISAPNTKKRLSHQGILEDDGRLIHLSGLPDITLTGRMTIYLNNDTIEISNVLSGHTDGDLLIYFKKANVLCIGDYLFLDRYPVIDIKESGANIRTYLDVIDFIITNYPSDVIIAPGHSGFYPTPLRASSIQRLRRYVRDLRLSISFIMSQKSKGKTIDNIIKMGLPEQLSKYDQKPRFVSPKKWITSIYNNYL